jgi:hypothetical protein
MLKSCYCPSAPWGGLAKRAWLVRAIREAVGYDNVLLLDAGDLFPPLPSPDQPPTVMRLYSLMSYDAVAIGDQELSGGLESWIALNASSSGPGSSARPFPWLSASFRRLPSAAASDPIAAPRLAGLAITDPAESLARFRAGRADRPDLTLLLAHQPADENAALAERLDGVAIVIGGHSASVVHPPTVAGRAAIFEAGRNGENLGVLRVDQAAGGPASPSGARAASPFSPAVTILPPWRITSLLVPLDTGIDEHEEAAAIISEHYRRADLAAAATQDAGAPPAPGQPGIALEQPGRQVAIPAGRSARVELRVSNRGTAPLRIRRVVSGAPWMRAAAFPPSIPPGGSGLIAFELRAVSIDRFFRAEYLVVSNDPERALARGAVSGSVTGPLTDAVDPGAILADLESAADSAGRDAPASPVSCPEAERPTDPKRVLVEYFYAAGCLDCAEMRDVVLPALVRRFGERVDLRQYDVLVPASYLHLALLQERLGAPGAERVSVFLNRAMYIGGLPAIRAGLMPAVEELAILARRGRPRVQDGTTAAGQPARPADGAAVLDRRFRAFSVAGVLVAGLVDGLNPCSFTSSVFLVSLLAALGSTRGRLLATVAGFCASTFATYLLVGFGLFRLLMALPASGTLAGALRWTMACVLAVLAILSARDAAAWRAGGGRPADLALRLPEALRARVQAVLRTRLRAGGILAGSLAAGVIVTLLESVCTGQLYVPTLVFVARRPELRAKAWLMLAGYNAMFLVPLAAVSVAACHGLRNERLLRWSRNNVAWSKTLLALLFAALAAAIVLV